ncbi:FAS1 domain-containing protein [Zychaea mexicana]|uniref:FAS1 domain-containing protein n=1 Tax=Zychaea mexicana TaxID=64656 RepID=UPI0022FEE641|nr:FAS1 domain-containing protein [Zychaea mexicana]KAI9498164.1 FAS1 domain-containing protein [Zychaea mexicana]
MHLPILVIAYIVKTAFVTTVVLAQDTIVDVLSNNGASKLHDLLMNNPSHGSLVEYMTQSDASYTLFAPSDDAMEKAGIANDGDYTDRIRYHIVPDKRLSAGDIDNEHRLRNSSLIPAHGKNHHVPLLIGTGPDGVWSYGNKSRIVKGDIQASNGVVHIIERALEMPGSAEWVLQSLPQTRDFAQKLKSSNMSLQLFTHATVFAPTNDAVKRLEDISDPAMTALTLQHLIVDKSFNATSLRYSDKVVDNHGVGFNVSHTNNVSAVDGVSVLVPDQIFDDGTYLKRQLTKDGLQGILTDINLGLIHITDGIVLRGGLDQPDATLPQPAVSGTITTSVSFSSLMTIIASITLFLVLKNY